MKKQVNVRLSPIYIELLTNLQEHYKDIGLACSQADVIERALYLLEKDLVRGSNYGEDRTPIIAGYIEGQNQPEPGSVRA